MTSMKHDQLQQARSMSNKMRWVRSDKTNETKRYIKSRNKEIYKIASDDPFSDYFLILSLNTWSLIFKSTLCE